MMKKNTSLFILTILILSVGVSACSLSLAQDVTPPPGYQPPVYEDSDVVTGAFPAAMPDPAAGQAIYLEKCLPCHGDTGLGDGPSASDLSVPVSRIGDPAVASLASPSEWYSIIMNGNLERFMPPFSGSLNDQDVWNVLSYVYSLGTDPDIVENGELLYSQICATCHGTGAGDAIPGATDHHDPEVMVLYSIDDLVQKIATGNGNTDHVFSTVLNAEEQQAVAYYVRSINFPLGGGAIAQATPEPTTPAAGTETPAGETGEEQPTEETTATPEPTAEVVEGLGRVVGTITNGSGGEVPEGLTVSLEVYENFELSYTESAAVNDDGSYAFEDVTIDPDLIYITVVELYNTFFPSAFHMGEEITGNEIDLPITIYDVTNSTEDLVISRLHVFFQPTEQGTIQVIHQVSISNRGDKLVIPAESGEALLNFALPEGASNIIFQTGTFGNPYIQTADGFADPTPVLPGESSYEGLFAYELPYDRKLEWSLPLDLPTEIAVIFVEGESTKVESDVLLPSGSEALDEDVYQVFVADSLTVGQEIDISITGSLIGDNGLLNGNLFTILLGVVGLGLAGYGAWRFFRPIPEEDYEDEDEDNTEDIIAEIVALDEAFEAGEIDEEDYLSKREALKDELKQYMDGDEAA